MAAGDDFRVDVDALAGSAAALQARAAAWLETSRQLLTNVGNHAQSLNNDGIGFAALERDNVEKLRSVRSDPA